MARDVSLAGCEGFFFEEKAKGRVVPLPACLFAALTGIIPEKCIP